MGAAEMEAFLTHLAVHEHVAASTQNQALNAPLPLSRCPQNWAGGLQRPGRAQPAGWV